MIQSRRLLPALAIIMFFWMGCLHTLQAGEILETAGIGMASGAVLGAATLPFYSEPLDHKSNVLIGSLLGALVGIGIWGYNKWFNKEEEELFFNKEEEASSDGIGSVRLFSGRGPSPFSDKNFLNSVTNNRLNVRSDELSAPVPVVQIPLVSLSW